MRYKKSSIPLPSQGKDFSKEKDTVVPNQAMSLQEIIKRFTRNESLPIGLPSEYGDDDLDNPLNVDLGKLKYADPVDKEAFTVQLQEVVDRDNENKKIKADKKAKSDAEAKRLAEEKRIEDEVERRTKQSSQKSA